MKRYVNILSLAISTVVVALSSGDQPQTIVSELSVGAGRRHLPGPFRDVSAEAGLRFQYDNDKDPARRFIETTGGGCAFFDFDNDGKLDILAVQGGPAPGGSGRPRPFNALYRNLGGDRFQDVTNQAGLALDMGYGQGVAVADFDNDGWEDVLITGYGGVHLLRNVHGRFEDVTDGAGLAESKTDAHWSTSAVWIDYDRDGWLDLFICRYASWFPDSERPCFDGNGRPMYCDPTQYPGDSCILYHNNHDGTFTNVSHRAGIDRLVGRALGAVSIDYDGDGWPDLFVSNDMAPNRLLHNERNGTFKDVGAAAGVAVGPDGQPLSGMGVAVADFTGSLREDLVVANFSHQPKSYYTNLGFGAFRWAGADSGLGEGDQPFLAFGLESFDFDLDGYQDLIFGNGHINDNVEQYSSSVTYRERQQLFRNRGNGRFDEVVNSGDLAMPRITRGLAIGDYDNDGRPDVLVSGPDSPLTLFKNVGAEGRHWIGFRLQGVESNRDGIGARVTIHTKAGAQLRVVRSGSSYCSHSDIRPLFGLNVSSTVDRLEIAWPGIPGRQTAASQLKADRYYLLDENGECVPDPRIYH